MSSSLLFRVNRASPVYNKPAGTIKEYYPEGKYIRITNIYLYNTSTGSLREIKENEILDSELKANQCKYLFVFPGNVYIKKDNIGYIQNFVTDMHRSDVVNISGTLTITLNGLYGPNHYSPVKLPNLEKGKTITIIREYKPSWVMIGTTPETMCWVPRNYVKYNYKLSGVDSVIDNTYTGNAPNYSNVQQPVSFPGRMIEGSGAENMLYKNNIKALIQSAGIYNRSEIECYDKFSRFGYMDPYTVLSNSREYVFITKPDLHIFASPSYTSPLNPELARMAIFQDAYYRYRPVLKQLQWSVDRKNPFMNLLSNSIKSSVDLPGISADEIDTSSNIYGTKMTYRKASETSDESFDFNMEFEDTKYLEVYMLFKLFDEYEKRKLWGDITPPDVNYIYRKILHDQVSIYKFIVADDGMSLIYWAKLTGCYPKSVPREAFSDISDSGVGTLRFTVQWHAQFVEDMDPQILSDFNTLIMPKYNTTKDLPLYNAEINRIDGTWAATPYISQRQISSSNNIEFRYILGWRV